MTSRQYGRRSFFLGAVFIVLILFLAIRADAQSISGQSCPAFPQSGVSIILKSDLSGTVPDVPIGINASLKNQNSYAINDGVLFVRVTDASGHVIDEFTPLSGIALDADEGTTTSFIWPVPLSAAKGDYRISTFLVSPHSAFVPAYSTRSVDPASLSLSVASAQAGAVEFDPESIGFKGATYDPAVSMAFFDHATSSVQVSIDVENNTDVPYIGSIAWSLFANGYSPLSTPPQAVSSMLELHPHTSRLVEYTVPVSAGQTEYLEASLGGSAHSIVGVYLVDGSTCTDSNLNTSGNGNMLAWIIGLLLGLLIIGAAVWELRTKKSIR